MVNLPYFIIIIFKALLVLSSSNLHAATQAERNQLKKVAENFVKTQIEIANNEQLQLRAVEPDPRIKLAACKQPLVASMPKKTNTNHRITVLLACPTNQWQTYVAVDVRILKPILVAKHGLARGSILTHQDLMIKHSDTRFHRGQSYQQVAKLVGAKVKRKIRSQQAITSNDVCMVCKDDQVVILSQNDVLEVATQGEALTEGGLGERIKVRNFRSNKIITAKISAAGKVVVNL